MANISIHEYLSPDIAAHCEKIGHVFAPLEMAVIVQYSDKAVNEKIAAWRAIMDGHPDMPIRGNANFGPKESLHQYLEWWIAQHENWMAGFRADGDGKSVFRPRPYLAANKYGEPGWEKSIGCHSTLEKALGAVAEYASEGKEWCRITKAKVVKEEIDSEGDSRATFNLEGELLEILDFLGEFGDEGDDLGSVFIHLPVPFAKGDIVAEGDGPPLVLVALPAWEDKGWCEAMLEKGSLDGGDQSGLAFGADSFFDNSTNHEHPCTFRLQYYKKELQGRERFLKAFSEFVKAPEGDRAGSAVHLVGAFRKFQAEADAETWARKCWDEWFMQPPPDGPPASQE